MQFFDNIIEQYRPHAIRLGNKCDAYALRIIARLDAIAEAVSQDDPDKYYRNFRFSLQPAGVYDVVTIPTGETWRLEASSGRSGTPGTGTQVALMADGMFAGGISTASMGEGSSGYTFKGGTQIQAVAGGAPFVAGDFALQFSVMRRKPKGYTAYAGQQEWEPYDGVPDPRQEAQETSRHTTPLGVGQNVNGSRRA